MSATTANAKFQPPQIEITKSPTRYQRIVTYPDASSCILEITQNPRGTRQLDLTCYAAGGRLPERRPFGHYVDYWPFQRKVEVTIARGFCPRQKAPSRISLLKQGFSEPFIAHLGLT